MEKEVICIPANTVKEKFYNSPHEKETGKIRVAAYCRVSTEMEAQMNSYENQVEYYEQYIRERPEYILVGIYGDEGKSGTGDKWRVGFKSMIEDCKAGKIDMVITKSISRFARNTQDCLKYARELKDLGIPIYFEKEAVNSMDGSSELFFTILSSLAQEESRNISENIKWAYRNSFQQGKVVVNAKRFLGFDKDENGKLIIDPEQAVIVRRIYDMFEHGYTEQLICRVLNEDKVPGVFGEPRWQSSTIRQVLGNEKNKGDLLLQKTYVPDYLTKRSYDNTGQLDQYYIEGDHEPIISPDEWEAVQQEQKRRAAYRKKYHVPFIRFGDVINPFAGKAICGCCKYPMVMMRPKDMRCRTRIDHGYKTSKCSNGDILRENLDKIFVAAWNQVVEKQSEFEAKWEEDIAGKSPLRRLHAKHMKEYAAQGKIQEVNNELCMTVLERIDCWSSNRYEVNFLDSTKVEITL